MGGERTRTVAGAAALALLTCTTALMNGSVFPQFDAIFTFARDISVTCSALALILVGFLAYRAPHYLVPGRFLGCAAACLILGGALLAAGLAGVGAVPLTLGAGLAAVGRSGAMVVVGLMLAHLGRARATAAIVSAFSAQLLLAPLAPALPAALGAVLFIALPLAALALAVPDGRGFLARSHESAPPSDMAVTRPASFLAPFSALFVCLFLFQVAFGFALRFDEVAGTPRTSPASALPVLAVAFWALVARRPVSADLLVRLSALAVIAGFLLASRPPLVVGRGDVALLNGGNGLFLMTAQIALVAIAARNPLGALTTITWGNGVCAVGSLVGAAAGMVANTAVGLDPSLRFFIPAGLLLVFAAYIVFGLGNFTFSGVIEGIEPVHDEAPAAVQTPEEHFAARCAAIAEERGLTPREAEVFAMLARGRDRAYIEEALVVSRNTVKAHVKHVYAKLGIHSHQELLDLVEG